MTNLTAVEKMLYNEANMTTQPLMHVAPERVMQLLETISELRTASSKQEK